MRIDRARARAGRRDAIARAFERAALSRACAAPTRVLVSDYGIGLVTPALVAALAARRCGAQAAASPILVDSRYDLLELSAA